MLVLRAESDTSSGLLTRPVLDGVYADSPYLEREVLFIARCGSPNGPGRCTIDPELDRCGLVPNKFGKPNCSGVCDRGL
jgi:hypothetical protein